MRRVSTSALTPGMVTAEDVYNYNNKLIVSKGTELNEKSISKLEYYSIINVRVLDEADLAPEEEPVETVNIEPVVETVAEPVVEEAKEASKAVPEPAPLPVVNEPVDSYAERLRKSVEFQRFEADFQKETEGFKETVNHIMDNIDEMDVDQLIAHTVSLLSSEDKFVNVFDMLHNMRQMDDSTYVHCMNVGLICNIFAHWLRMSEEDIKTATLCGLLHDIGKIRIPTQILKKPARLTEWEFNVVRTHPKEGYDILINAPVNDHVKNAALMHHERCDGSGYPLGLSSNQIDPFAKIVAIADVYDAMTSARVYRGALCPFEVIAAFENEGYQKYDPEYILKFLENIVDTYMLHRVRLTNGEEGEIVYINPDKLSKPTIKVGDKYINLANEPHLFIDSII